MKIEKLEAPTENKTVYGWKEAFDEILPQIEMYRRKINALIDALSETERNRSEQMARMIDNHMALVNRVIELENAAQPKPKEYPLLPCPFCGEVGFIQFHEMATFNYQPSCSREECVDFNSSYKTKQEAISAWNKRA